MNADDQYEAFLGAQSEPMLAPPIDPSDDISARYLEARRDANAPSSPAWEGALKAGMDPGEVVLGKPIFDHIETRTDGEKTYRVGVDNDNPENSVVLEVLDFVEDVGAGILKGTAHGLQEAGQEIGDTLMAGFYSSHVMPWMRENIPYLDEVDQALASAMKPEGVVQETTASIASPVGQVQTPGSIFTRSFRAAGIGSRFLAEGLGYGAAEVAAVSPTEATLLELGLQLIDDAPELQSALNAGLAAREDENAFVERIKNAPRRFLEGGPVGMLFERALTALGIAYKVIRNSPAYKKQILPGQPDQPVTQAVGIFSKLFGTAP